MSVDPLFATDSSKLTVPDDGWRLWADTQSACKDDPLDLARALARQRPALLDRDEVALARKRATIARTDPP